MPNGGVCIPGTTRVSRRIISGAGVWCRARVQGIVRGMEAPNLSPVDPAGLDLSSGPDNLRFLIAHGDNLSRAGLHALLDDEPDISIAGSAGDGEDALRVAQRRFVPTPHPESKGKR